MMPEKWQTDRINCMMKKLRLEDKSKENSLKQPLKSFDVVNTKDFVFSPIEPFKRVGDSGPLLLGKRKGDNLEQYLVKHAYCDCACNEFVYTKLAQAMGYKMPDVVLFAISLEEKRKYFKTEYIMGARYLNIVDAAPSFETIKAKAENWKDYFSFQALYAITDEGDAFETPLVDDGFIYRVDTTDAFPTSDYILSQAGINIKIDDKIPKEILKNKLLSEGLNKKAYMESFDWRLNELKEKYGKECIIPFLQPFKRIQAIQSHYIDNFLNTLCYFYPDFIGDFFKKHIKDLQVLSCEYLQNKM